MSIKDVIPNNEMVVMLTEQNYIKRMPVDTFSNQNRGGKGVMGLTTKEEDVVRICKFVKNHDEMLFFTNKGRVFKLPVYETPEASRISKGQAIVNFLQLQEDEKVTAILNVDENSKSTFLFMATKNGTVKKTELKSFDNVRKTGIIAINLRDKDELKWVKQCNEGDKIIIASRQGKAVVFEQSDVRPMGRSSTGVRGIRLKSNDEVIEMDVIESIDSELLVVMENGLGKMSPLASYRLTNRGAGGVKAANITAKTGLIVGAKVIDKKAHHSDLVLISKNGQTIRMEISEIPSIGRSTQGVYIMRLNKNDKLVSLSLIDKIPEIKSETNTLVETEAVEIEKQPSLI